MSVSIKPPQPNRIIRLGVNIDHVATLRQARLAKEPSIVEAALEALRGGADGITVHLREDRRHIQDQDVLDLRKLVNCHINLEMSVSEAIVQFALAIKPDQITLVPEKREELTTEGGLDVIGLQSRLIEILPKFKALAIQTSLFIDPDLNQTRASATVGANAIEFHTGYYANNNIKRDQELNRIAHVAKLAASLGLKVFAGHGLTVTNVAPLCQIPEIDEFNIGHHIVCRAVIVGLRQAVEEMKSALKVQAADSDSVS